jgi:nitrogen fixation/metabolism regulation signal transduction histidine kinase
LFLLLLLLLLLVVVVVLVIVKIELVKPVTKRIEDEDDIPAR